MTPFGYNLLLQLARPLLLIRLAIKALRHPAYRLKWLERFGYYETPINHCIWLHAVSMGEAMAAAPLIVRLQQHNPQDLILVTTTTPSGFSWLAKRFGHSIIHAFLPYDYSRAMQRFFEHFRPKIGILIETELWPNLLTQANQRHIPMFLVNGRLSTRALSRYRYSGQLTAKMLTQLQHALVQSAPIATRFQQLGLPAKKTTVTGNLKFCQLLPDNLATQHQRWRRILGETPCWVAASTHPGEEQSVLKAHQQVLTTLPQCKLILAPRHPERCHKLLSWIKQHYPRLSVARLSTLTGKLNQDILMIDTLGDLSHCFSVTQAAFIGGSLIKHGGHNPIEALLYSTPVVCGPHMFNFDCIHTMLQEQKLCQTVDSTQDLATAICRHLQHPSSDYAQACQQFLHSQQQALERTVSAIQPWIPRHPAPQ